MADAPQNKPAAAGASSSTDDDWAAAMAEQAQAEAKAAAPGAKPAAATAGAAAGAAAQPAQIFPSFNDTANKASMMNELDMILDIPVQISVELGRAKITIKNLLQLAHGSVVELDAMAGEPMSVFVNGTLIAQGEVVVVNDKFGIRLTDIITPSERMRKLGH
ncbi:MAG: flagellar motor switch protein FliN [Candidatus Accumulibacter sp.]|jgi:flagellar motor switch protein FliN/FliY|nr:flagellar motor switch protein FliN [Accumulibacter sp.]